MAETNKHLDALLSREREQNNKLGETVRQIKAERDRIAFNRYGVSIGSVVLRDGVEFRVTKVDTRWGDKPWLEGNQKRKDGTFGNSRRHIYGNWELVKP